MAKPMYLTIDLLLPSASEEPNLLVKKIDESYLEKTFRDMLQKGLDPEADKYNSAYNANDRNLAAQVQSWFNEMNANPDSIQVDIVAITKDEPPQEIRVALNDIVSDYSARILKLREETDESGQKISYNIIDLAIAKNVPGGLDLLVVAPKLYLPDVQLSGIQQVQYKV